MAIGHKVAAVHTHFVDTLVADTLAVDIHFVDTRPAADNLVDRQQAHPVEVGHNHHTGQAGWGPAPG